MISTSISIIGITKCRPLTVICHGFVHLDRRLQYAGRMRIVVTGTFWALAALVPFFGVPRAWAATVVIDPTPLGAPSIRDARRLGVVVVGQDSGQAKVAADLVQE